MNAPQNSRRPIPSTSASGSTIAASLPPSSRVNRLRSGAAAAAISFPVATDPVKLIFRTAGCWVIHAPSSSPPLTTLTTPAGSTWFSTSPSIRVDSGVKGDGFSTTVLPARSAGPSFQPASRSGKFQGVMAATTPSGLRSTTA